MDMSQNIFRVSSESSRRNLRN